MTIEQASSAIMSHLYDGLRGLNANIKISIEQLQDEVVAERLQVLREWLLRGAINLEELYLAINCVEVDCSYMSKCCDLQVGEKALHFEIPPIVYLNGVNTVKFVGSIDRHEKYNVYTDESYRFHKHRKRGADNPYVYIDTAINSNGNIDGYIFNVPFVQYISVVALFQDPRKVLEWDCCSDADTYTELGLITAEVIKRLTEKYLRIYRQMSVTPDVNNQIAK